MEKKWRAFNDFLVVKKNGNEPWKPSISRMLLSCLLIALASLLFIFLIAWNDSFTDIVVALAGVAIAIVGLHSCYINSKNTAVLAFGVYALLLCAAFSYIIFTIIQVSIVCLPIFENVESNDMKANAQLLVTCAYAFIAMLYGWVQVIASKESEECKRFLEEDGIDDRNASQINEC